MLNPTTAMVVSVIDVILAIMFNAFIYSAITIHAAKHRNRRIPLANLVWYWCKWPALAHILSTSILSVLIDGHLTWWRAGLNILNGFLWWAYRDTGDDNDHKKLRKKLKEKVTQVSGRLVVVPQPA